MDGLRTSTTESHAVRSDLRGSAPMALGDFYLRGHDQQGSKFPHKISSQKKKSKTKNSTTIISSRPVNMQTATAMPLTFLFPPKAGYK